MNNYSLMNLNLNFYNPESDIHRTTEDVVEFIITYNPTFVTLQEFGNKSLTGDVDGNVLLDILKNHYGYLDISPIKEGNKPINTRILYLKNEVIYKRLLYPIYDQAFTNRQTGAIFEVKNKSIAIYSLHLPLYQTQYQDNREDKMNMWEHTIRLGQNFRKYDHLILAGDFNESKIGNRTALSDNLNILEKYLDSATNNIPSWKRQKIDHIFISKGLTHKKSDPLVNNISDHKALLLEFEL